MKKTLTIFCVILVSSFWILVASAAATPTNIIVRVLGKGSKFVGTSMGGALVTLKDANTGEVLAKGITEGTTGNTDLIMKTPRIPGRQPISDNTSAKFTAEIDIDAPTYVEISAYGPLAEEQSATKASVTQWILPGKDITLGDAILLELPGFAVKILSPSADLTLGGVPQSVEIRASVSMMCGCPIEPGGLWDADKIEIEAAVKRNGGEAEAIDMNYAGERSQFEAAYKVTEPGTYEVTVSAFDPSNGNTGLDKTTFTVE